MMAQAQGEIDEIFEDPNTLIRRPELDIDEEDKEKCEECIYGYDFFEYAPTTFAPTESVPISSDYILGPGDSLDIYLYLLLLIVIQLRR